MRVVQLSDLHLGPEDHEDGWSRRANGVAWANARRTAATLSDWPDADELIIVITGDLTDNGHLYPAEFGPVRSWLATLPGTVYALPGNHDVGNFASSRAEPKVSADYVRQWREAIGPDRFSRVAEGRRLIGLNSMLIGSGLEAETEQHDWLVGQLDAAESAGQGVWVFQHAPLFLRQPDEVRSPREHYWCPAAGPRDEMLDLLDQPCVQGLSHGHTHRRQDTRGRGKVWRSCPALSGTHSEADYFPPAPRVDEHDLTMWTFDGERAEWYRQSIGIESKTRYVS